MQPITNYHIVNADDLDLAQMGEYYLKYIHAMKGDTLIYVNANQDYYFFKLKRKDETYSEIKDISMNDLRDYGLMVYPRFKNKDLALMLLAATE